MHDQVMLALVGVIVTAMSAGAYAFKRLIDYVTKVDMHLDKDVNGSDEAPGLKQRLETLEVEYRRHHAEEEEAHRRILERLGREP